MWLRFRKAMAKAGRCHCEGEEGGLYFSALGRKEVCTAARILRSSSTFFFMGKVGAPLWEVTAEKMK